MLGRFIMWLTFDYPSNMANLKWAIKMIAIKLKLYKPNQDELECIEYNKKIKKNNRRNIS